MCSAENSTEHVSKGIILSKIGEMIEYAGKKYVVGEKVIANKNSVYEGLIGTIYEIHTDTEKETCNETPDIYCRFREPVMTVNKEKVRRRLSEAYKKDIRLADVGLDCVIMSPEMLVCMSDLDDGAYKKKVYLLIEDAAVDSDTFYTTDVFADMDMAQQQFEIKLSKEMDKGMLKDITVSDEYVLEVGDNSFEYFRSGRFCEWHYSLKIIEDEIVIPLEFVKEINKIFFDELVADNAGLSNAVKEELGNDKKFLDKYVSCVNKVAEELVIQSIKRK